MQQYYRRSNGNILEARLYPCMLMGSRKGRRPVIQLARLSPGFQDPDHPKPVIRFWARSYKSPQKPQPNISHNQILTHIDVTIGEYNPGAIGIRHRAAQGSGIQDCVVDATHGLIGVQGGVGSGGCHAGVTVIGGAIGLDLRETQPSSTIVGMTLTGQRERAILYAGRQTLSAVGLRITKSSPGPAIETRPVSWGPHNGQLCLVDSEISFTGPPGVAVAAGSSVFMQDVFVLNGSRAVQTTDGLTVPARPGGWARVPLFAHGMDPAPWRDFHYTAQVYVRSKPAGKTLQVPTENAPPPADLVSRHLWDDSFPHFEAAGVVNAKKPPYSARGDGLTDDTKALQRAVDENETVFLPKGYYLLSRPLRLRPGTRLLGAAKHLSTIMTRGHTWTGGTADDPLPLVQSADDSDKATVLAFLGLFTPLEAPGARALEWRSGGRSMIRDLNVAAVPPEKGFAKVGKAPPRNAPLVLVTGHGGGQLVRPVPGIQLHQRPALPPRGRAVHAGPAAHLSVQRGTRPRRDQHGDQ